MRICGSTTHCRLTNRSSGCGEDKVPSPGRGSRAAQPFAPLVSACRSANSSCPKSRNPLRVETGTFYFSRQVHRAAHRAEYRVQTKKMCVAARSGVEAFLRFEEVMCRNVPRRCDTGWGSLESRAVYIVRRSSARRHSTIPLRLVRKPRRTQITPYGWPAFCSGHLIPVPDVRGTK